MALATSRGSGLFAGTWSQLPVELIQEILLFLASIGSEEASELRLISKGVNKLVVPYVFRHVILNTPDRVTRFSATLAPKRQVLVPALRQFQTMPPNLVDYKVQSLTLVVNKKRPSIEVALANVGAVFTRVRKLAITGDQLLSNAHWLRLHPISPQHIMIVHHGRPALVNFYEPLFECVTHLYTSSLYGHHNRSSVLNLPCLTHLAVSTRVDLSLQIIDEICTFLRTILSRSPIIQHLVLHLNIGLTPDIQAAPWLAALQPCLTDKRFDLLPYQPLPRMEWRDIALDKRTVWDRAKTWRAIDSTGIPGMKMKEVMLRKIQQDQIQFRNRTYYPEGEWDIDLVQHDHYEPQEMDPDQRGIAW